ncbi:MAG: TatD family hydrolase [Bdellovibrionota bacterium]
MELIDSHAHLYMLEHADVDTVLSRAAEAGVSSMVTIGTEQSDWDLNKKLGESYENVYYTLGAHPHSATSWEEWKPQLLGYFKSGVPRKCVAIGEIGLDYFYDNSPRKEQLVCFEEQLELAKSLDLPIAIHCREAFEDLFEVLQRVGLPNKRGVMHCFTGTTEEAKKSVDLGFKVSFSGILTFKKAEGLRETAKALSLDSILIETDCPFLTPEPHRGKPNEPSYLPLTAKVLSSVLGRELEDVVKQTTENTRSVFSLS